MANIKSQKDRVIQTKKETARNKAVKSNLRSTVKKTVSAIEHGEQYDLANAVATVDKAASKGVMHKNTAARRVSKLMKKANAGAIHHHK